MSIKNIFENKLHDEVAARLNDAKAKIEQFNSTPLTQLIITTEYLGKLPIQIKSKLLANYELYNNDLTSYENLPEFGLAIDIGANRFTNLKDIHKHLKQFTVLNVSGNDITSNILGVLKIKGLKHFYMGNKEIERIIEKYLPEGDILECQQELIDAGYEEYAKL